MKRNDDYWMKIALKEAKIAFDKNEVPVGAVIVCEREGLLAQAHNITRNACDPCGHAEIQVIREAAKKIGNYRLSSTTLYTTLEPCPMCAGAMIQARVSRLVFATRDWVAGAAGSVLNLFSHPSSNHQLQIDEGNFRLESQALLKEFFRLKREEV